MFLVFALLLLSLGVGLFLSMYSVFFPFFQQISDITYYNSAYYSALSSVERGSLVLKYRVPGFEGSGGFIGSLRWGPKSDATIPFLSSSTEGTTWQISSRTLRIPLSGDGDTDILLQTGDTSSYNTLGYTSLEVIPLSYDNTSNGELFYTGVLPQNISYFSGSSFTGMLRLPPVVVSAFGGSPNAKLCDDNPSCDLNQDDVNDEVKVNRSLAGFYLGSAFKIVPTSDVFYYSGNQVNLPYDSSIRASRINNLSAYTLPLSFAATYSPLSSSSLTHHNVISSLAAIVKGKTFHDLFVDPLEVSGLQLSLGIISLLLSDQGSLYPYLEYNFTFPQAVSNTMYTLDTHGRNAIYDVEIVIKKPTTNASVGGDFTVIF